MSRTVLYLDPWSGVSGDMLLAGLLDTDREGRLETVLRSTVDALGLEGTAIEVGRETLRGVECTRVKVDDGDTAPLRHLQEMEQVIMGAPLSWNLRERATAAVRRLAEVEARVHGCSVDEIHFHEVGAVDTLVDVVGVFALVEALGVDEVCVGTIPVGGGKIEIAHGVVGVPAPATVHLLENYPVQGGPEEKELTTPTGALLVGELGARPGMLPAMRLAKVGYGGGWMELERTPNVLRVVIGTALEAGAEEGPVVELATNLDDVSPEVVAHTAGLLLGEGALDVWTVPVQMKKGRGGTILHVLVDGKDELGVVKRIFEETGTLGVRRSAVSRHVAERGTVTVEVAGQTVGVKWGKWEGSLTSVSAEYEDCARVAEATGMTARDVGRMAENGARETLDHQGNDG